MSAKEHNMHSSFEQYPASFEEALFMRISKEMLVHKGYDEGKMRWDRTGISGDIYLRYGYWEKIIIPSSLQGILILDSYEDEECGMLYKYNLKHGETT